MATGLYALARNSFLISAIPSVASPASIISGTQLSATLVNTPSATPVTPYTVNLNTDQFFSIIPAGAVIATTPITGKSTVPSSGTSNTGALYCANIVFSAVTGNVVSAIVIWYNTGTNSTSPLIAYIDASGGTTGLPVTPNGSAITLSVPTVTPGLFML